MKHSHAFLPILLGLLAPTSPSLGARVTLTRTPDGGIQPQAAIDSRGVVHLIYFKGDPSGGDIFYVHKRPGETEFSKSIKVNSHPRSAMAIGTIRGAHLAIGRNGRVHVAWNGNAPEKGGYLEAPMLYTRLNDAGTAFEPDRNVITFAKGLDGGGSVAADNDGNVFVMWHAPNPSSGKEDETGRAVFIARSTDDGKSFTAEKLVSPQSTGACGCCGMKAFAGNQGEVFALYRGASEMVNRSEILLLSRDHGSSFTPVYEHPWKISTCPMSSAFLSQSTTGIFAAGETHERVFFLRIDPKTGKTSDPVSPETKAKHPIVIANKTGEILFTWTEGTAWEKGGNIAWQLYDKNANPVSKISRCEGVPVWSLVAAYAEPSGDFVVVY
ncbi:MAG TPA: sialidase family protein [Candidatus Limnocylindrales bacterium]|nr:sialidase family protein [Candidatus Limnocylindrales bacterium]